jgi:hypothetical protein
MSMLSSCSTLVMLIRRSYAKQRLTTLHPNILVQRSPSHFQTGTFYWAHVNMVHLRLKRGGLMRRHSTRSCASSIQQSRLWGASTSALGGKFLCPFAAVADLLRWVGGIHHSTASLMTLRKAICRSGQVIPNPQSSLPPEC